MSLNRLSASVRIWTYRNHLVYDVLRYAVLIAFRLQSEFGQETAILESGQNDIAVLIAFRLQSEF